MKLFSIICLAMALPLMSCVPAEKISDAPLPISGVISDLAGSWEVALYFSPDQPPSSTALDIKPTDTDALEGQFYGTDFEFARAVKFKNEVRLSFVTSDGSGPYASAARLLPDGTLSGQTLSTGRDFLIPWTATKISLPSP